MWIVIRFVGSVEPLSLSRISGRTKPIATVTFRNAKFADTHTTNSEYKHGAGISTVQYRRITNCDYDNSFLMPTGKNALAAEKPQTNFSS
jgi:hypothetical protein